MSSERYVFHVDGMHCKACVALTESELSDDPRVTKAHSDLKARTVEVEGDFGDAEPEKIVAELSERLSQHSLSLERTETAVQWREFTFAVPIALAFVVLFVLLQKSGIVNLVGDGEVSYATAFLIGIVASLSTCMALVGGLVLSMSATFAQEDRSSRPLVLFHAGRLVSFFILGGAIGAVGSLFRLGSAGVAVMSLVVGVVMLLLGVNLLGIFRAVGHLQVSMPRAVSRHALAVSKLNHTFTPALVGVTTFFLPCGFTQSMQLYAISTGSFLAGAGTMLAFALGTFPVLALLSFAPVSIHDSSWSGIFFKSAGIVVIAFAALNIVSGLTAAGIIDPIFNL